MDVNELEDVNDCQADVESDKKRQKTAVGGATEHTSITAWANPIARLLSVLILKINQYILIKYRVVCNKYGNFLLFLLKMTLCKGWVSL